MKMQAQLRRQLEELEYQAEHSMIPGAGATYLNHAGDLCLRAGEDGLALEYFGQAIDAHVKADRFAPAMALCRKVLRIAPAVVRARCTLTWLAIGNGFEGDACTLLESYVLSAERAGRERLALSQLKRMGDIATGEELRFAVGDRMLTLGDERAADHLFGLALAARNGKYRPMTAAVDDRWSTARRAALLGPRDLAA